MRRSFGFASFACGFLLFHFAVQTASGQSLDTGPHSRPAITQSIDDARRVPLPGNTRPEATMANDRGRVPDDLRLEHMLLQLKRSPEVEASLDKFIEELQTPGSPNYHQWISAQEFGARFGVAAEDLEKITNWLQAHHMQVNVVYPSGMMIDFSGTAGQVRQAFGAEIHNLEVKGQRHIANINNPGIPAAMAPVVAGIVSLHDFRPRAMYRMRGPSVNFTFAGSGGNLYALVPADLATIYNLNPLFAAGYSGQGQTILVIEDTDVFATSDWTTFRSTFGLSSYSSGTFTSVHPAPASGSNNCGDPGVFLTNDGEAILDAEWASAAAPGAAIELAACADTTTTFGGLIAMQNILNAPNPPAIMSVSYGECETLNGAAANAAYSSTYQLGVAQGVSIFVSAGDSGATVCDNGASAATDGIGVSGFASTPYNVGVGGTDFSDTFNGTNSIYWNAINTSTFGSAVSYIPEIPWNDSCAGALLSEFEGYPLPYGPSSLCNDPLIGSIFQSTVAGSGGPSGCATGAPSSLTPAVVSGTCQGWPKPSWQSVVGNPNDGVRDTPDISLFAANGLWTHYYVFCWSDLGGGGANCTGDPSTWSGAGGTSFSSPIMAGIQAIVNQKTASRQGNPNPALYQLAAAEYGPGGNPACNSSNGNTISPSCIFYDVTLGDMDVNCASAYNCYFDAADAGVLSTSNNAYQPAYGTTIGWDFATGIGTVNATNLVNNWPGTSLTPGFTLFASPASIPIILGTTGTTSVSMFSQGGFNGNVSLSLTGLPTGVTAAFSPANVSNAANTSTLTFTVSSSTVLGTSTITITGTSGSLTRTTTVSLTINPVPVPTFTVSASPANMNVPQGRTGTSTITVTPLNGFNGIVALSATGLPAGVTASFNPASTTNAANTSTLTLTASSTAAAGIATVTVTGTSGNLTVTTTLSLNITLPLPGTWVDGDIGATGQTGSASYASGTFTVYGSGAQIFGTVDAFHFVYQQFTGDGTIIARLVNLQGTVAPNASVGVMIRNTLDASSANAKTAYWPFSNGIFFDARSTAGAVTNEPAGVAASPPYWIRVTRNGNTLSSYVSPDGVTWSEAGTVQTVPMGQTVYMGLAVTSGTTSALAEATFDNVSFTTPSQGLPSPWADEDQGDVGIGGNATYSNGTFTVNGAGQMIYGSVDAFNFLFQPLTGDGAVVARVVSVQGASTSFTAAGVMIRNTLDAASANVKVAEWPTSGSIYLDLRTTAGSTTTEPSGVTSTLPYWVKLNRSGNTFTGYTSKDGVNWAQLGGAQTVSMGQTVYAGLAVTSGSITALSSATFDNVSVGAPPPPPPTFTLSASPASVTITQGASGGTSTVTVTPQNGFTGTVSLSASGMPSAVTASFNPTSTSGTSTLTLTASATAATGPAAITITGTSGSLTSTTNVSLTVNAAPVPSFTLSASPGSVTVTQGGPGGTSTLTVSSQNGFSGSVALSASGVPTGVAASFSPTSTTSPANNSTLTLTASATATTGTATITITGNSGSLTAATTVSLTVNAAPVPTFTLSASPSSLSVVQGATGTSSVTVTPQNGFNGNVALSANGMPTGVTASFNPTSTTSPANNSTLTLTASGTATTGTTTITITGTSGNLTRTTSVALTVTAAPSTLPPSWTDGDIGSTGKAGNASYSNGTFTVNGAGSMIYGSSDAFHFVYQPLTGDGSVVARVVSMQGALTLYTAAGVMIRNTLDPAAANAKTAEWPDFNSVYFDLRSSSGSTTSEPGGISATLPYWVKVSRSGSNFSTYASKDGVNWVPVGSSRTITMSQTVYVGLAVTSGSTSSLTTATFDNVSVSTPPPPTPNFTLSASPASLSITQGGSSAISTVTVTPQNGFGGSVALSASGVPSGITASFNPASTSGTSALTLSASSTATTGSATITITGTSGSSTSTTNVSLTVNAAPVPGFTLSASPASVTIIQGTSSTSTLTVTPQNGFSGSVALSASGVPAGVTASFSPTSTTSPTNNSTLTLTASSTATTGNAAITITGISGSLTAATTVSLTVNTAAAPNFTLSTSPNSLSVVQGATGTSTVTVTPQNGFSGSVALSATGMPSGVTASFSPTSTTSPTNSSTLTLTASGTATTGTATITITGTSGSLTKTTTLSLTVTAAAAGLPSPWTDGDVGTVGKAGSASYSNGTFTVNGAGSMIYGNADAFNFVYQPLSGDGTVIARVVSMQGALTLYTAAGVMIRNTLDPAAANAKTAEWPDFNSIYFDLRSSSGSTTTEPGGITAALPYWVKVSRSGSTFSSYASKDGVNWVPVGSSRTITMGQTVYLGLAVTSGSTSSLTTATFDNVSVTQP